MLSGVFFPGAYIECCGLVTALRAMPPGGAETRAGVSARDVVTPAVEGEALAAFTGADVTPPAPPDYEHVTPLPTQTRGGRGDDLLRRLGCIPLSVRRAIKAACDGRVTINRPLSYALLCTGRLDSVFPAIRSSDDGRSAVETAILFARGSLIQTTFQTRRRPEMERDDREQFRVSGASVVEVDIGFDTARTLASAVNSEWNTMGGGYSSYPVVDGTRGPARFAASQGDRTRSLPLRAGTRASDSLAALTLALVEQLRTSHQTALGGLDCLVCYAMRQDHSAATTFRRHVDGEIAGVATLPKVTVTIMVQGPRHSSALHVFGDASAFGGAPEIHVYSREGIGFLFPSDCPHATVPGLTAYLRPPGVMKLSLHFGEPSGDPKGKRKQAEGAVAAGSNETQAAIALSQLSHTTGRPRRKRGKGV